MKTGRRRAVAALADAALAAGLSSCASSSSAPPPAGTPSIITASAARPVIWKSAAPQCEAGRYPVGSVHHYKDSSGKADVTSGECFDVIDNLGSLLNTDPKANQVGEDTFCTKLRVEPEMNAVLGHGVHSFSTFTLLDQSINGDVPKGACNWSEDYLHLVGSKGFHYWHVIPVNYITMPNATIDYNKILDAQQQTSSATVMDLTGIGTNAERIDSMVKLTNMLTTPAHTAVATDANNVTMLIGDHGDGGRGIVPDLARKALKLAESMQ